MRANSIATVSDLAVADMPVQPTTDRQKDTYEAVLSALDAHLTSNDDLSFEWSDIEAKSDRELSEIQALFPTREAVLTGLAQHYVRQLGTTIAANHSTDASENWEGIVQAVLQRGREFYDGNPVAMKLRLGPGLPAGVHYVLMESLWALAELLSAEGERLFILPEDVDMVKELYFAISISDALWSLSVLRHGYITDELAEEAERAAASYLEPTFGKQLKLRAA